MPRSLSAGSNSPAERLPVNPRRHKVAPEQRKRVATACNNCNLRRIKCSGDRPCAQCVSARRLPCQYPVAVDKVSIPRNELEDLRARCAALERSLQEVVPDAAARQQLLGQGFSPTSLPTGASPLASGSSTTATEGRLLTDVEGTSRWMGGTSGASFLDHLKHVIFTIRSLLSGTQNAQPIGAGLINSVGEYQTHDSRPLFQPRVAPLELPSPDEADSMLRQVRWYIQDGFTEFNRDPTVPSEVAYSFGINYFGKLDSGELPYGNTRHPSPTDTRYLAFYQAAFAYASLLKLTTPNSKQDGRLGETYFARALALLGNPLEPGTFSQFSPSDMSALALMALYMAEVNRRDVACIYMRTAIHLCIMHGVHYGHGVDEASKRVFWTLYCLDRWISCLMGRPPGILDNAIRLEPPVESPDLPPAEGLRQNMRLAKIAGYVVCDLYGIAPGPSERTFDTLSSHIHYTMNMLSEWRAGLPPSFQVSDAAFDPNDFPTDRSVCSLYMSYNQLIILTTRPIFFTAVKKAVGRQALAALKLREPWDVENHREISLIRQCSDAARHNLSIAQGIRHVSPRGKLVLQDLHGVFNAAIILLLHQIVFLNLRTGDISLVSHAIEMFSIEAAAGDNYGKDCASILQQLEAIAHRLRGIMFPDIEHSGTGAATPNLRDMAANLHHIIDGNLGGGTILDTLTEWADLDTDTQAYVHLEY